MGRSLGHQRSAGDDHGVLAAHGVPGAGANVKGGTVQQADIVVGGDTGLALRRYVQRAFAAENELAFGEEGRLFVLFVRGGGVAGTVGQRIAAIQDYKAALLALVVDGGSVGIGNGNAVKHQCLLVVGINLQKTVGGGAAELVLYLFFGGGVVHGDLVACHGYNAVFVTGHRGAFAVGESNGNGTDKLGTGHQIFLVYVNLCGGTAGNAGRAGLGISVVVLELVIPGKDGIFIASCDHHGQERKEC